MAISLAKHTHLRPLPSIFVALTKIVYAYRCTRILGFASVKLTRNLQREPQTLYIKNNDCPAHVFRTIQSRRAPVVHLPALNEPITLNSISNAGTYIKNKSNALDRFRPPLVLETVSKTKLILFSITDSNNYSIINRSLEMRPREKNQNRK